MEETSARQVLFALERPGSTASSFAVRTQEELTAAGPTAAHLGDFRARWRSGDVVASWRLEVAEGVARIQLQRAIAEDGPWDPVGDAFGADAISPSYEVVDVQPRAPSLYRVELVTDDGVIELYGPIRPEEEPVTGCTCRTVTNRRVSHAAILLLVVLALAWRRPRA